MPNVDGYTATKMFRTLGGVGGEKSRVAMAAMTANAMEGDRDACLAGWTTPVVQADRPPTPGRMGRAVYPMLPTEHTGSFSADFDKKSWMQGVSAFRDTARTKLFPPPSNDHGPAMARTPGFSLARRCRRGCQTPRLTIGYGDDGALPDIGFDSYGCFFPSQDTMPAGGSAI